MDKDALIQQFISIAPCETHKAQFYLEANNWDIDAALSNFYEEPPMSSALPSTGINPPAPLPAESDLLQDQFINATATGDRRRSAVGGSVLGSGPAGITPVNAPLNMGRTLDGRFEPVPTPVGGTSTIAPEANNHPAALPLPSSSGPRVATLASLGSSSASAAGQPPMGDAKDPQNWFTGGEKSGMMVEAPPRSGDSSGGGGEPRVSTAFGIVDDILRKAADGAPGGFDDMGDEGGSSGFPGASAIPGPTATARPAFQGAGHRLGTNNDASVTAPTTQPPPPASMLGSGTQALTGEEGNNGDDGETENGVAIRYLTFYRNGFVIADGPLFSYNDPNNLAYLEAIQSGRAPLSLLKVRPGQPVEMRVAKRMDEDYVPEKPTVQPFAGHGQRLGSNTAPPAATSPAVATASGAGTSSSSAPVPSPFEVDSSQPITSIQVRLADGTRLVIKLNHTHRIADLRQYILAQRPQDAARPFILQTSFPTKTLTDESQTVKDASLLNSVVVQKYQ
ncbi:protein phosphatase regulator [Dimargaris verticillata]|uniref:Protein phosphatase regulator n=1 Tax=Dimargaris verticillata TaxID=2761393 RepID=A0A9W8BCH1_9FUNG|nr:protein phosphatase regulator [Dimargaris verticillata]